MKWTHVNHRSGAYQEKSASQGPTPLPLSHAANPTYNPMDYAHPLIKYICVVVKVDNYRWENYRLGFGALFAVVGLAAVVTGPHG